MNKNYIDIKKYKTDKKTQLRNNTIKKTTFL